jgi:hypothetical protein
MGKSEIMGSTGTAQNACPGAKSMLYLPHEINERSIHDGRRASPILTNPGMESDQEKEKREGVLLRQEMAAWRCLHRTRFKGGNNNRRANLGEACQGTITNKATVGWQMTTKSFVAFSLPLKKPGKLARDKLWISLLIFSIVLTRREVKIRQIMGMR